MVIGLAMLLAATAAPPDANAFDLATVGQKPGAAGIIDRERDAIGFLPHDCRANSETEIVVCARHGPSTSPRLPMPGARFEAGENVRYYEPGTPTGGSPRSCARPGSCEPPRLGETLGAIFNWLGGNDPPPPPMPK